MSEKKYKVGWIRCDDNWAFKNVCKHFQKQMKEYNHLDCISGDNQYADVYCVVSPSFLKYVEQLNKVILHLDSERALK